MTEDAPPLLNFNVTADDGLDVNDIVDSTEFHSYTMFRESTGRLEEESSGPVSQDTPATSPTSRNPNSDATAAREAPAAHAAQASEPEAAESHVDPTISNDATPPKQAARNRSATSVMVFNKNSDPNAASPPGSKLDATSAASSPGGAKKMYSVGAIQVKSASIADVVSKSVLDQQTNELVQDIIAEARYRELLCELSFHEGGSPAVSSSGPAESITQRIGKGGSKQVKAPPTSLPTELKLPMPLRCDFCQKFDSVCSNCHFKWRGIAASRKAVFTSSFAAFPEHRRLPIFFNAAAYGTIPFLSAILDTLHAGRLSELQAKFEPLYVPPTVAEETAQRFDDAGQITLLHVACGMNRKPVAKLLLERGALFRKSSDRKISPLDLVGLPVPQEWQDALEEHKSFEEFTMIERARRLRAENRFEDALLEYQAVIKDNPYSELARCGIAKTMYDQGDLDECIRACDSVLHDQKDIKWLEHIPQSVELLRSEAVKAFHAACHNDTSTALRKCGCVIIDPVAHRISIRKLNFRLLIDRVLPYCDCATLWGIWQATRMPLLQSATERIASKIGLESVGMMLTNEFGYAEMYETLRADEPPLTGPNAVLKPPLRFLGVQVIAMADFHTFLMRGSIVGSNPKYAPDSSFFSFGKKSEESKRQRIVATKCFRVNRASVGKAWDIRDGGEWEIDYEASDALLNAVQQRMANK
jgi:hypothetical protein